MSSGEGRICDELVHDAVMEAIPRAMGEEAATFSIKAAEDAAGGEGGKKQQQKGRGQWKKKTKAPPPPEKPPPEVFRLSVPGGMVDVDANVTHEDLREDAEAIKNTMKSNMIMILTLVRCEDRIRSRTPDPKP